MTEKITAILGPTNTGKTYYAVEQMLKHKTGIIGFPLRLLARENYEYVGKKIGKSNVALITGEEKIIPKYAKYFFCTVESMPTEINFDFLAIDEIQMASNQERGHLFTEKLISFRGSKKTLFLGSNSMSNILKKFFPKILIFQKPRLSKLNYYGYKNLSRLPPRSAIIAFSQIEVYAIAETLKKFKGGVSVVTGALSPEARNAQVSIFENGEVDYIVATDAIGLGLNLQIKYVFFTSLIKFDGIRKRYLTYDEFAQIAGRAGRHLNDGFFGVTQNLKSLDQDLINFVENCEHKNIEKIFWRNSQLNFDSVEKLIKSLKQRSKFNYLILKKNAPDLKYLNILANDKNILKKINSQNDIKLLWDICRVPDYTKTLDEFHSTILRKLASFLLDKKLIPEKWIENEVKKIKSPTDQISIINQKITQIRTWSYISNKNNWVENSEFYKKKIKKIENFLSNRLHFCLIKKFVDHSIRNSKKIVNKPDLNLIKINKGNHLLINEKSIGCVRGLKFFFSGENYLKKKKSFNYKYFKSSIDLISKNITKSFVNSKFQDFDFDIEGRFFWKKSLIGFCEKRNKILSPEIKIISDENFSNGDMKLLKQKLQNFFNYILKKDLIFLLKIKLLSESKNSSSNLRAFCYCLFENLGFSEKNSVLNHYKKLDKQELFQLKNIGLMNGSRFFYFKSFDQSSLKLSQMLANVFYKLEIKSFFLKRLIHFENKSQINQKLLLKLGYIKIKICNSNYYLDYYLFEKLIRGIYFWKKKNLFFNKKILAECENDLFFLKKCFSNPKLLTLFN